MPRPRWLAHPRTKGAMTHATIVGITVTLVTGLAAVLPDTPHWLLFTGGLVVAMAGFAGLWLTNGANGRGDDGPVP